MESFQNSHKRVKSKLSSQSDRRYDPGSLPALLRVMSIGPLALMVSLDFSLPWTDRKSLFYSNLGYALNKFSIQDYLAFQFDIAAGLTIARVFSYDLIPTGLFVTGYLAVRMIPSLVSQFMLDDIQEKIRLSSGLNSAKITAISYDNSKDLSKKLEAAKAVKGPSFCQRLVLRWYD